MDKLDKKKRHVSGSRSKSNKSKPNDASVDLKPHKNSHALNSNQQSSKVKTQNSLNKSKGSKKCTKVAKKAKFLKSTTKMNNDQSKQISRSLSAQRKHSLAKMNRTQANFEAQDIERRIYTLKKTLKNIQKPNSIKSKQIYSYFRQIQDSIQMVSEPLYSLLCNLHELYMAPMTQILEMIAPYQHLLKRKQQLSRQVEDQVRHNQQIYSKLSEEDIYIIKLKQTIQEQRQLIDQKKKQEAKKKIQQNKNKPNNIFTESMAQQKGGTLFKNEGLIRNMRKDKTNMVITVQKNDYSLEKQKEKSKQLKSTITFKDNSKQQFAERDSPELNINQSNSKKEPKETSLALKGASLKLDLGGMNKGEAVGFHDQFYSKIDEFSQSWRNQALKQKRF